MMALAESAVTIIVACIAASATVAATVLPSVIRMRRENRADHNRVKDTVDVLIAQVGALTEQTVKARAEILAHTKWEESQKYATADHVATLIEAIRNTQNEGDTP